MATTSSVMFIWKRRLQYRFSGYIVISRRHKMINMPTSMNTIKMKPPNILVCYSAKDPLGKEGCPIRLVEKCLTKHSYVVYPLMYDKMMKDPWMENCRLLVLPYATVLDQLTLNLLENFVTDGGKVLSFCRTVAEHFAINVDPINDSSISCCNILIGDKIVDYDTLETDKSFTFGNSSSSGDPLLKCSLPKANSHKVIALKQHWPSGGCIIHCSLPFLRHWKEEKCCRSSNSLHEVVRFLLSKMDLQTDYPADSADETSPLYIYCSDETVLIKFINDAKIASVGSSIKGDSLTLEFCEFSEENPANVRKIDHVPVLYSINTAHFKSSCQFNWNQYRQTLISKKFGKIVLYSDIVTSTMDVAETLVSRMFDAREFCVTCIARQQTKGKGRGGNKWLSPLGTAMTTMLFSLPSRSYLGERLPIMQHIMTVAVVHSIRSIPAFKDLDLRVKWPNDIYFGSSVKIGGVLVRSTMFHSTCIVTVGCGVNVDNPHPTLCINKLISDMGVNTSLSCDEVLALAISEFERLIQEFQQNGPDAFMSLYYKYWLHSKQRVKVQLANNCIDAEVIGIDEFGFLCVRDLQESPSPKIITLQPDDNSFDMMKNMIAMKLTSK